MDVCVVRFTLKTKEQTRTMKTKKQIRKIKKKEKEKELRKRKKRYRQGLEIFLVFKRSREDMRPTQLPI